MKRMIMFLGSLALLNSIAPVAWADDKAAQTLVCYSMTAAKKMMSTDGTKTSMVAQLGGITQPLAIILDNRGDIILVGHRNPQLPQFGLDDVVMALKTAGALNSGDCPGASIDPPSQWHDQNFYQVRYFGGTANTRVGQVFFEADLLLKKMGFGLESTGLPNVPTGWDLLVDRVKAGYQPDPWERQGGRNWFFPALVKVSVRKGAVVLHACKIAVMGVEINNNSNHNVRKKKPKKDDESPHKLFAKAMTENYDAIAQQHPVLADFKNLMILSALMKAARELPGFPNVDYWLKAYQVEHVPTPTQIPLIYRGVSGYAYGLSLSGGVTVHPVIYRAKAGDPVAIRELVLSARPSPQALTWSVAIDDEAIPTSPLDAEISKAQEKLAFAQLLAARDVQHADNSRAMAPKANRHPKKNGDNLFEIWAGLGFSYGAQLTTYPANIYLLNHHESRALNLSVVARLVRRNRFELALNLPLQFQSSTIRVPRILPGLSDAYEGYVGGLGNAAVSTRFLLSNGSSTQPTLQASLVMVTPWCHQMVEGYDEEIPQYLRRLRFGHDFWTSAGAVDMELPLSKHLQLATNFNYVHFGNGAQINDQTALEAGLRIPMAPTQTQRISGIKLSYRYIKPVRRKVESLTNGEKQFILAVDEATRHGVFPSLIGMSISGNGKEKSRNFFFSVSYGLRMPGTIRKWF